MKTNFIYRRSIKFNSCNSINLTKNIKNIVHSGLITILWVLLSTSTLVGFKGYFSWIFVYIFILFILSNYMLWRKVFDPYIAPLEIMFWLFNANFLLLPALNQIANHRFWWSSYNSYTEEALSFGCIVIAIGFLSYLSGNYINRKIINKNTIKKINSIFIYGQFNPTFYTRIAIITIFCVLFIFVSYLGIDFFTSPRLSKINQVNSKAELGLLLGLPRSISFATLLFCIAFISQCKHHKKKIPLFYILSFYLSIIINLIVNFPLTLSRFWFFGFLISVLWIIFPFDKIKWRALFILAMTLLQFTLFPWFSQITRNKGLVHIGIDNFRKYLSHGDFDGYQQLTNIGIYINGVGFEFGRNLTSSALFFIPRSFWYKAKPLGTAASEYMRYNYTNLSAPIYGELYADFGYLSLIFGMFILGFLTNKFDLYYSYLIKSNQIGPGVLFTSMIAGYSIIIYRGSLLGVLPTIVTLFFTVFLLTVLSKPKPDNKVAKKYI